MLENGYARFQKCHFWFLATLCDCGVTHEGCTLRINYYMWFHHIRTKFHENWSNGWKFAMGTDREGERERQRCTRTHTHVRARAHTHTHTQHGNLICVLFKNSFLVTKVDWLFMMEYHSALTCFPSTHMFEICFVTDFSSREQKEEERVHGCIGEESRSVDR